MSSNGKNNGNGNGNGDAVPLERQEKQQQKSWWREMWDKHSTKIIVLVILIILIAYFWSDIMGLFGSAADTVGDAADTVGDAFSGLVPGSSETVVVGVPTPAAPAAPVAPAASVGGMRTLPSVTGGSFMKNNVHIPTSSEIKRMYDF